MYSKWGSSAQGGGRRGGLSLIFILFYVIAHGHNTFRIFFAAIVVYAEVEDCDCSFLFYACEESFAAKGHLIHTTL